MDAISWPCPMRYREQISNGSFSPVRFARRFDSGVRHCMKNFGRGFLTAFSLGLAAWLVLALFEGDACADSGGRFNSLAMQCHVAPSRSHVPLAARGHWPFWAIYSVVIGFAAAFIFGLLSGLSAGLRSTWADRVRD